MHKNDFPLAFYSHWKREQKVKEKTQPYELISILRCVIDNLFDQLESLALSNGRERKRERERWRERESGVEKQKKRKTNYIQPTP